jgi:hypothetical protein
MGHHHSNRVFHRPGIHTVNDLAVGATHENQRQDVIENHHAREAGAVLNFFSRGLVYWSFLLRLFVQAACFESSSRLIYRPSKEGFTMRTRRFDLSGLGWQTYILIGLTLFLFPSVGFSQNIRSREGSARILPIENLSVSPDGAVLGEVVNRSSNTMRDVQILIRQIFLWEMET